MSINKSVFNFLRQLTINVALRTFAAARRAEARLLLAAGPPPCSNRSISFSRRAHSSKPTTAVCGGRVGQTGGGAMPPYRQVIAGHYECKAGQPGQWSLSVCDE